MSTLQELHTARQSQLLPPHRSPILENVPQTPLVSSNSPDLTALIHENAALRENSDFLKRYITRCEAELRNYQSRHPEELVRIPESSSTADDLEFEELPPWLTEAKYMSPLLVAYEARMNELQQNLATISEEASVFKAKAAKFADKNDHLEKELQENIKKLLELIDQDNASGDGSFREVSERVVELQEQLSLYREQVELLKVSEQSLHTELLNTKQSFERKMQDREDLLTQQITTLKEQILALNKEKEKYRLIAQHYESAKTDLDKLREQYNAARYQVIERNSTLEQLQKQLHTSENKEQLLQEQLNLMQRDLDQTITAIGGLENAIALYKQKELEMMHTSNEATEKVAQAELARDVAITNEEAAKHEVERLTEQLRTQRDEHQKHTESQLAHLYARCKENETRLKTEIKQLILSCAEMEANRDRALREARIAHEEAEKILSAASEEAQELRSELTKAHSSMIEAQNDKTLFSDSASRLKRELERTKDLFRKEREMLQNEVQDLKIRIETNELNLKAAHDEVISANAQRDRISHELTNSKQVAEETIARLQIEIQHSQVAQSAENLELKTRLDEAYRLHEHSEQRAQDLLASHDKLLQRYKEENRKTFEHFQKVLAEYKEANIALTSELSIMEARLTEATRNQEQYSAELEQTRAEIKRYDDATAMHIEKISQLTVQARAAEDAKLAVISENKQLQLKLDRFDLEHARLQRQIYQLKRKVDFQTNLTADRRELSSSDMGIASIVDSSLPATALPRPSKELMHGIGLS